MTAYPRSDLPVSHRRELTLTIRHGGPGGDISTEVTVYFNPEVYRIIVFSQRGAGKSTPYVVHIEGAADRQDRRAPREHDVGSGSRHREDPEAPGRRQMARLRRVLVRDRPRHRR